VHIDDVLDCDGDKVRVRGWHESKRIPWGFLKDGEEK